MQDVSPRHTGDAEKAPACACVLRRCGDRQFGGGDGAGIAREGGRALDDLGSRSFTRAPAWLTVLSRGMQVSRTSRRRADVDARQVRGRSVRITRVERRLSGSGRMSAAAQLARGEDRGSNEGRADVDDAVALCSIDDQEAGRLDCGDELLERFEVLATGNSGRGRRPRVPADRGDVRAGCHAATRVRALGPRPETVALGAQARRRGRRRGGPIAARA